MATSAVNIEARASRGFSSAVYVTSGARWVVASDSSVPPVVTITGFTPRSIASSKAATVSSVLPECERAMAMLSGPTKAGTS